MALSPRRYQTEYDAEAGSWGVLDTKNAKWVGHAGTETGARIMCRKRNLEAKVVRSWAKSEGFAISNCGPIPDSVKEFYDWAEQGQTMIPMD